jgi:hypothetical protein
MRLDAAAGVHLSELCNAARGEAVPPGYPIVFDFQPDIDGFFAEWLPADADQEIMASRAVVARERDTDHKPE